MKKTFKKLLAVVLAVMMLATVLPVALAAENIASGTAGENVTWVIDSEGTLTISGSGKIVVGWHDPPWKAYNDSILRVVVENGITEITSTVFYDANYCTSVSIPASVEHIAGYAFPSAESIEEFIVDGNNSFYKSIDGIIFSKDEKVIVAFPQNKDLTEYIIPDSVETIGDYAFYSNNNLKKITVPDSVTAVKNAAFEYSRIEEFSGGKNVREYREMLKRYGY